MSSFPCKSAYRPEGCPPLSDSDEENTHKKSTRSKSGGSSATSSILGEESHNNVESLAKSSAERIKDAGCWFVDRSTVLGTRTDSLAKLQTEAETLQTQIEEVKLEKERIQMNIRQKKKQIIGAIEKVIEFEDSIQSVEASIADKLHHYQTRLIDLETKRMDIFLNSGDAKVRELLESEIDEIKEEFNKRSKLDEAEMNQLTQAAQKLAAEIGDVIELYQNFFDESITDAMSVESPAKLEEMEENFSKNMKKLRHLMNRAAQFCYDKAGKRFYLNVDLERVYKAEAHSSEFKLNADGEREKINDGFTLDNDGNGEFYVDNVERKIYTKYYFEDDYGRYYIDVHGSRFYKSDPEASEYMLVNGNWKKIKDGTYSRDERGLRIRVEPADEVEVEVIDLTTSDLESDLKEKKVKIDDIKYIKEAVGPAIRKGLAAVALHQPADPIAYFANFLLNYRYNKHMFEKREEELNHFLDLRSKLKDGPEVPDCE